MGTLRKLFDKLFAERKPIPLCLRCGAIHRVMSKSEREGCGWSPHIQFNDRRK